MLKKKKQTPRRFLTFLRIFFPSFSSGSIHPPFTSPANKIMASSSSFPSDEPSLSSSRDSSISSLSPRRKTRHERRSCPKVSEEDPKTEKSLIAEKGEIEEKHSLDLSPSPSSLGEKKTRTIPSDPTQDMPCSPPSSFSLLHDEKKKKEQPSLDTQEKPREEMKKDSPRSPPPSSSSSRGASHRRTSEAKEEEEREDRGLHSRSQEKKRQAGHAEEEEEDYEISRRSRDGGDLRSAKEEREKDQDSSSSKKSLVVLPPSPPKHSTPLNRHRSPIEGGAGILWRPATTAGGGVKPEDLRGSTFSLSSSSIGECEREGERGPATNYHYRTEGGDQERSSSSHQESKRDKNSPSSSPPEDAIPDEKQEFPLSFSPSVNPSSSSSSSTYPPYHTILSPSSASSFLHPPPPPPKSPSSPTTSLSSSSSPLRLTSAFKSDLSPSDSSPDAHSYQPRLSPSSLSSTSPTASARRLPSSSASTSPSSQSRPSTEPSSEGRKARGSSQLRDRLVSSSTAAGLPSPRGMNNDLERGLEAREQEKEDDAQAREKEKEQLHDEEGDEKKEEEKGDRCLRGRGEEGGQQARGGSLGEERRIRNVDYYQRTSSSHARHHHGPTPSMSSYFVTAAPSPLPAGSVVVAAALHASHHPHSSSSFVSKPPGSSLSSPLSSSSSSSRFYNSVIQQGWLQKWTNLVSSWRPRYFYVLPGLFKYSVQKNAPPKEVFLLNQCIIRLCPHDPVRFEVEVIDQQILYLRTESVEEKQLWYAAFKQAQRALINCTPSRRLSAPLSSSSSSLARMDTSSSSHTGDRGRGKAVLRPGAGAGVTATSGTNTTSTASSRPERREKGDGGGGEKSLRSSQRAKEGPGTADTTASPSSLDASRRTVPSSSSSVQKTRRSPTESLLSSSSSSSSPPLPRSSSASSSTPSYSHPSSSPRTTASIDTSSSSSLSSSDFSSSSSGNPASLTSPPPPPCASAAGGGGMAGVLAGVVASGMTYAAAYATSKLRGSLLSSSSSPSSSGAGTSSGVGGVSHPSRRTIGEEEEEDQEGGSVTGEKMKKDDREHREDEEEEEEEEERDGRRRKKTGTSSSSSSSSSSLLPSCSPRLLSSPTLETQNSDSSLLDSLLGKEGSPLVLLLEHVISSRQQVQVATNEIRALQAGALKEVGTILNNGSAPSGGYELKSLLISLLQKIDEFQLLVERHFSTTEALLGEENSQRSQLERSLRSMAKQNYKLEKSQQRMLALTSSAHESGVCTPGSTGVGESFSSRGRSVPHSNKALPSSAAEKSEELSSSSSFSSKAHARGTPRSGFPSPSNLLEEQKTKKASHGARAAEKGALLTSSSEDDGEDDEDDDDTEFFECEDQESYFYHSAPADGAGGGARPEGLNKEDFPDRIGDAEEDRKASSLSPSCLRKTREEQEEGGEITDVSSSSSLDGRRRSQELREKQEEKKKKKEEEDLSSSSALPQHELLPSVSPAYRAISLLLSSSSSDRLSVVRFLEITAGRLGGPMPHSRTALPTPRTEFKIRLWSILKDCIGKDLSRISMPVYFNEPTSFLQRLLEDFQYADLIYAAPQFTSSVDRLLLVTLFATTPYASATGRTYKPFNPLLGETFEFVHRGYRFISEQVGHHPPRTAYHVSNDRFLCWGDVAVRNRFTGKSLEVTMPGTVHVVFPTVGDHFTYRRVRLLVHNVIWGKLWAEVDGTSLIQNQRQGDYTIVQFLKKGWLDKSIHMIRAVVFTAEGYPVYRLTGAWSHSLYLEEYDQSVYSSSSLHPSAKASDRTSSSSPSRDSSSSSASQGNSHTSNSRKAPKSVPGKAFKDYWRSEGPPPSDSPDNKLLQLLDSCWDAVPVIENSRRLVWRPAARPSHSDIYYGFGYLTMELNEIRSEYDPANPDVCIARTDSRFRPDQRSYEEGRVEEAIEEKTRLEEKQRAAARSRPRGEEDYDPLWFAKGRDPITDEPAWIYKGGYWEAKTDGKGYANSPDIF